ncbi:Antitoxin CptB [Legionella quinlivanii]|uniref:FAD assembly factor SdhE n=1 Tax=Legionella quinlivanii TaxID=45073 RepID=A0A0W0Y4M8_9GAMM|nr:succinate dehydrogenase assembly factor 2 [Legionella quinlivanii]KTD51680.1 Antitoxin CptB [Legionella quinlivanii]MCW8451017.1 succinate dehydrogenase assembly factor 2 [Legionella quinlivanii]SEF62864.1 antitoxin CptB [Legionella quinlivanii DSM 21216]STY10793.1 YgfY [Legionella quinlivanii]
MIDPIRKARIEWRCRRGMLELDLLFQSFLEYSFAEMKSEQFDTLERLLSCDDPDLYNWLMTEESPEDKELSELVQFIKLRHRVK